MDSHEHHSLKKAAMAKKNEILQKVFGGGGSGPQILWGLLHIKIVRCKKLRNLDRLGNIGKLIMTRKMDKSDPYVMAFVDGYRLLKTQHYDDDLNPEFNEVFYCPVAHITDGVTFKVKDKDIVADESLGKYFLPVRELIKTVTDTDMAKDPELVPGDLKRVGLHKIVYLDGKKDHGTLEFNIEFIPTRLLPKTMEVPGVYFKTLKGNDVKLYMNADDDGSSPVVKYGGVNDDDKVWTPPRLWRDIYDAICNAKHFIYVVGWSVDVDQYLLRGPELRDAMNGKYSARIGDLLVQKSEEGVVVNLMQWDDQSSNMFLPGMMGTHDEKARKFFKSTKVTSRFMALEGGESNTFIEGTNKKMAFTHHQKFVVCDAARPDGEGRELQAFIGGIDLTEGRWDNQKHPLFRSLQSEHRDDVYTKCFKVSNEHGPRQPWHDIHSAVRGPEAIHLCQAFEERWEKQGKAGELINRSRHGYDNATTLENKGGWCAQLSRSIDSRVNAFDPAVKRQNSVPEENVNWTTVKEKNTKTSERFESDAISKLSYSTCLDRKKGRLVDNSIHLTNIHHIRRAEHFIYIESQYFMGSSFMWDRDQDVKCGNMLAAEIALKICEKIAASEPFAVYILLPMWMEGIPAAGATQGLLYYQRLTIEAMYKQVQAALDTRMANSSDFGLEATDYLNFYCLGNRENPADSQATKTSQTEDEKVLNKTRRHQIYIHSKMMIVDDDVALIGTANINQRSMDGCRDSEIMMTSWQTDHLATGKSTPKGDIHAFRMHVWASITNQMNDKYRHPSSPECVRAVNKIANDNWAKYMGNKTVDMDSHLLPFPLEFFPREFDNGGVGPRTGLIDGDFPDTKAKVVGKKSLILPEIMLT